ncbi:MAG: type II toxin-antitoxin system RelE family toxin [Candidatus Kapaibacteriota bacterium]|jgi:mRNA interferase RelE/StbE
MKLIIDKSFQKDYQKIKDKFTIQIINDKLIEFYKVDNHQEISNCKKLVGYRNAYRVKVGNYRIGFLIEDNNLVLIRCLPRKDIYKYFP